MYIYTMKPEHHSHSNKRGMLYHHELNLEYEHNATYFIISEIEDGIPHRTFYYKIPETYKDNSLLGELHERYAPYCPN
jgi:hypothetical protein